MLASKVSLPLSAAQITECVAKETKRPRKFFDNHGHLPPLAVNARGQTVQPGGGDAATSSDRILFGIDHLLTYHYNRQSFFGIARDVTQAELDKLTLPEQGDLIWKRMFVESHSAPIDVARLMILNILKRLSINSNVEDLSSVREAISERSRDIVGYHEDIFNVAGISGFVGTQDPFNARELEFYKRNLEWHPLFSAALRLDALVLKWAESQKWLSNELGYPCTAKLSEKKTIEAIQRFVREWIETKLPRVQYVGLSIPPTYKYTAYRNHSKSKPCDPWNRVVNTILTKGVFPVLEETGRKLFLMPEVIRGVNPQWREAGDYFGKGDMTEIASLAADHPHVDFWVTPLNPSSIPEVMAMARVLPNVSSWGIWWYNLQPAIMDHATSVGMDMFASSKRWPFNSDARVLEHLIGKWDQWRGIYERHLAKHFLDLAATGWQVTEEQIRAHIEHDFDPKRMLTK